MLDIRRRHGPEEGAILIIAIGILTLLAILGATFANLMRLEKQATQNYIDSQEVDLIGDSALETVIADLRGASNWWSYTPYRAHWLHKIRKEDDLAHGRAPLDSELTRPWEVITRRQKNVYRYKLKVIDTSAQININGQQDTLGRMLDSLARAIQGSPRLKASNNPFQVDGRELLTGVQILEFRNKLEGNRFRSKTQIRELIGQANYEMLKDFITVEAFVDPYTYRTSEGQDEILQPGVLRGSGSGGGVGLGGGGAQVTLTKVEDSLSARLAPEPRSPININTAPEEVLIACLQGIGARRPLAYSRLTYSGRIDEGSTSGGAMVPGREERDTQGGSNSTIPRGVWVYTDRTGEGIPYDKAVALARRIIAQRKESPFVAWSTGDGSPGSGGFAEFINRLEDSFFPTHERAFVQDPHMPAGDSRADNDVRRGGSPEMFRVWSRPHDPLERTHRTRVGLPVHTQNAFFYELIKGAIIANANPNTRINRYNPDTPAYLAVDKSDLVRLDRDGRTTRKGHTTEFCFDTNGVYEVTTLSEIAEAVGAGTDAADFRPLYQKGLRTVVKVFDVLRHTNQFHFEKTFQTGDRSSRSNRRFVSTCPDPMVALTDVGSRGSRRDGYVKLAGFNDARRLLAPPASRHNLLRAPEMIIMAHPFQDRDEQSYAQLRRMGRVVSSQYKDELLKVLWPGYSRKGRRYQEMYSRQQLTAGGLGYTNQRTFNLEPVVDTEDGSGSDLYPDGFHQGLFTSSHLGGRFVHLVAHERMGFSAKGGQAMQVGAGMRQDVGGNVAYYRGGIAFWVKFEFNGDDPVFSGLIGCTQVVEDVGQDPKDSEGSQFYIFKNTDGYLRVVRMYYHQAFPDIATGGDGGGGEDSQGTVLWPPVDTGNDSSGGQGTPGQNPILEHLDPRKIVARADLLIDVRKFRAHDWHHIAIDWDDSQIANALQVHIDFERVQGAGPYIRQAQESDTPSSWTRLNCRRPRDELFIGGFIRAQGVSDSGVFKWFTNFASAGTGGRGGVQTVDPTVKRILANATIDELITYEGSFQGVRSYFGTGGAPGYFSVQPGEYANVFEVPLPPEVDYVVLRSFDWTAYYPAFYTTREGAIHQVVTTPIVCQVFPGRENIAPFQEPWRPALRNAPNPVANRRLQRREAKGIIGTNADLVYQFRIPPGKVQSGPLAGGSVQTPILDDVTLTYFLPDPKILLQEEAEVPAPAGVAAATGGGRRPTGYGR